MGLRSLAWQFLRREYLYKKDRNGGHYSTSSSFSDDDDDPKSSCKKNYKDSETTSASRSLRCEAKQTASPLPPFSSPFFKLAKGVLTRRDQTAGGSASSAASPSVSGSAVREGGCGGGRSVSSTSQSTGGRTGPLQRVEPLKRQITGPFQLDEDAECCSYFFDDKVEEGGNDGNGKTRGKGDLLRLDGRKFEITEESKKIILSCLADTDHRHLSSDLMSSSSPHYQVEICAKGFGDDDTLDGIMTEKLSQERARQCQSQRGGLLLFRARSGGSSSGGILSSLRSASSLVKPMIPTTIIQGRTGRGGGAGDEGADEDTLDEFMSREFKEDHRHRERNSSMSRGSAGSKKMLRVGSGILERLDRLRRSNSKLLDRNELWLKKSLEAIEAAKLSCRTNHHASQTKFRPTSHVIVRRSMSAGEARSPDAEEKAGISASSLVELMSNDLDRKEQNPHIPALLEKLQDKVEAILPQCATEPPRNLASPFSGTEEDRASPSVPNAAEDDASVTLAEVLVHYMTCGHVLRENELQRSPRVTFSTSEAAMATFCAPPVPLVKIPPPVGGRAHLRRRRPQIHPRVLCASSECVGGVDDDEEDEDMDDHDEDHSYLTDDDTQEDSLRRHTINSDFARSTTESTYEEKKGENR